MNFEAKSGRPIKLDWKKIAVIAIVLAVAGYQWYVQNQAGDKPVAVATGQSESAPSKTFSDDDYKVNFPGAEKESGSDLKFKPLFDNKSNSSSDSEPYLQSAGGRNLKSPGGLFYSAGREHRAEHVLLHAQDDPDRPVHGVFTTQGDDVFRLVDEAYGLVKSNSKQVKTEDGGKGKTEYVIDMKRKIGYKGGQSGKRANYPALYKVKLILADKNIVTAYPF